MKKAKRKFIEYNQAMSAHGYENVRWIENASDGLRLVGFADVIASEEGSRRMVDHKGWFTDEDCQDETYRGIVYQLPSRDGKTVYVYGYADPNNEDCALLCFSTEESKLEAAKAADRFAEIFAEHEREYQTAWHAGRKYDELAGEIVDMRRDALAIGAEMRAAKGSRVEAPTICATLRREILNLYRQIQKARKERGDLLDNYGRRAGFVE